MRLGRSGATTLVCPTCGLPQDNQGSAVAINSEGVPRWVPFIGDLRGAPFRLVHPACFARESGQQALEALIAERQ